MSSFLFLPFPPSSLADRHSLEGHFQGNLPSPAKVGKSGQHQASIPLARALAVVSRARVPDAFVRHDCGCGVAGRLISRGHKWAEILCEFCYDLSNNRLEGCQPRRSGPPKKERPNRAWTSWERHVKDAVMRLSSRERLGPKRNGDLIRNGEAKLWWGGDFPSVRTPLRC